MIVALAFSVMVYGDSVAGQTVADPPPSNLIYRLDTASEEARAGHVCPSVRQRRYAAEFRKRYGRRSDRLVAFHTPRVGADPDYFVISSCRMFVSSPALQDAGHRKAMQAFEPTLRALEREFSPPIPPEG